MMMRKAGTILLVFSVVVSACASPAEDYPSLAVRPNELPGSAPVKTGNERPDTATAGAVPADLKGQLAQLEEQARASHQAFSNQASRVSALVEAARGARVGSLAWGDAQVALSDLDSHRSRTAIALADADLLYAERAIALAQRSDILETRDRISALLDEEDRVLARLKRGLGQ